jgi:hypothetical protein
LTDPSRATSTNDCNWASVILNLEPTPQAPAPFAKAARISVRLGVVCESVPDRAKLAVERSVRATPETETEKSG